MSVVMKLPDTWAWVCVSDVLSRIETGKSFKCDERTPQHDEVGVVKVSAVSWGEYREHESKTCLDAERVNSELYIQPGDFLFSRANTQELVGACVIAHQTKLRVMLSDKILRFRFEDHAMKPWLLGFLRSADGRRQIESLASGNQDSMRNIGQERIGQIQLPLPPRAEQTRIVAKLEELLTDLDAGVAELKAAQKKLGQYRQSLLKAAVEGALTAEWRSARKVGAGDTAQETGSQLLQRILAERRARWEAKQLARFAEQGKAPPKDWQKKYPEPVQPDTSDLPELPEGWVWATAEMLFSWGSGVFLPASAQIDGDYPVYGGNGINGRHNAANVDHATIVIGRVGVHCGNVYRTESSAWVTDNAIYATSKHNLITWQYSELAMQAANLGSSSKGGAQPFISQKILNDTFIALPPLREQERIVEEYVVALNANEEMATSIEISSKQSAAQRRNILKAAFSGQLVPQDPNDEPASVLLERIRSERANRAVIKKPRGRSPREDA